jgi:hypothetical protein
MIVASFGRIAPVSGHDHEEVRGKRPHGETKASSSERVWQTVTVTSGRIIIGWRVGT